MVLLLFLNLFLIVFDLTYLFLRPYYFLYAPKITAIYDEVKGVKPHPLTDTLLRTGTETFERIDNERDFGDPALEELKRLTRKLIEETPYAPSGQSEALEKIIELVRERLESENVLKPGVDESIADIHRFWNLTEENFASRKELFKTKISPLLAVNYDRKRRLDGEMVDHFFWLDLPFLIFFLIEFLVRWRLAVVNKTYVKWFLFPLYNWYDIVGLLPGKFRIFRIFRLVSIYIRLYRSEFTTIGNDVVSRTVKTFSNVFVEEISDMVAIRILTEVQDEIRSGASIDIFLDALEPRRGRLKKLVVNYTHDFVNERENLEELRDLLKVSLNNAASRVPSLKPVPGIVKKKLMREIGLAIYDAIHEGLLKTMADDRKKDMVGNIVDYILDDVLKGSEDSVIDEMFQEIAIDVLENMKKTVAVKKWALPTKP